MITEEGRAAWRENAEKMRASPRLKEYLASDRNPLRDPRVRARAHAACAVLGWPMLDGGNGKLTRPQKLLAALLGWEVEVSIPTKAAPRSGHPSNYKVDVGNAKLKIAVEVDGKSHASKVARLRDGKKDALLRSLGWKVIRLKNEEVMRDPLACARRVLSTT